MDGLFITCVFFIYIAVRSSGLTVSSCRKVSTSVLFVFVITLSNLYLLAEVISVKLDTQ